MLLLPLFILPSLMGHGRFEVDASHLGARIPKGLYGVFLEEINNAGEGGLYSEMIQNRGFEDANLPPGCTLEGNQLATPKHPSFWEGYSKNWTMDWPYAGMTAAPYWSVRNGWFNVVSNHPLSPASPHAAEVTARPGTQLVNDGFWGMNVVKGKSYDLSLFAQGLGYKGELVARLVSADGRILASAPLTGLQAGHWKRLKATLTARETDPKAKFSLVTHGSGRLLVDFVSLMPQEKWHGLPLRPDLAQMIADLKPGFVRWPGGCVAEGITIETRPQWKQTIGPLEGRTPTFVPWGYWVSNGFGYHEWLRYCEELKAEPLYVFNAGISCAFRSGTYLSDQDLGPEIQNMLDAIEYATGPVTSKYGAMRARAGHPRPFPMHRIEIGNEDQGPKYGERFKRIAAIVKAKYPNIETILSSWIGGIDHAAIQAAGPQLDVVDEHAYRPVGWSVQNFDSFARYPRTVPWSLYIGEFATNSGVGRGNMKAALGDAAYMMNMEKNSDLVKMGSYAPLLENINRREWEVNLIHFDSARAFGRASYYACKLFSEQLPDVNLATHVDYSPAAASPIEGPIGIGTFGTSAEFKDVRVDGQTVEGTWKKADGDWSAQDGVFAQKSLDFDQWGYFGKGHRNSIVTLKARKIAGSEGFAVSIGNADGRRVQFNLGGWGNTRHGLEAQGVIRQIPGSVETNRWYDVRLESHGRNVKAYLDGKLLFEETLAPIDTVLAIAGRDQGTGDIVVKVLNTGSTPADVDLDIRGAHLTGAGTVIQLSSPDAESENSFEQPRKIVPVRRSFRSLSEIRRIPANSLSILRLKTR